MDITLEKDDLTKMTDKYLIAFDMDGTLLRSDNTIGPRSLALINKFIALGQYVTVASGRPPRVILPYYFQTGMNGPIVSYNGAYVYEPRDLSFNSFRMTFRKEDLVSFVNGVGYDKFDIIMAESDKKIFIKKYDPSLDSFFHHEGMEVIEGDFRKILSEDTYTMIVAMKSHDWDERLVKCAFSFPGIGLRFWGGAENKFSELYHLDITKTSGLERAREFLGLDREHVIVIGDADNDVEMLTDFPNSIAMVNGEDQVKARAHFVSDFDNNHDGAALAVDKLLTSLLDKGK